MVAALAAVPTHAPTCYRRATRGRRARALDALASMGSAVLGSALTTVSSLLVMSLCRASIFRSISTLATRLICTSLVLTLCLFVPLLMLVGPTCAEAADEARIISDDAVANGPAASDAVVRELETVHAAVAVGHHEQCTPEEDALVRHIQ